MQHPTRVSEHFFKMVLGVVAVKKEAFNFALILKIRKQEFKSSSPEIFCRVGLAIILKWFHSSTGSHCSDIFSFLEPHQNIDDLTDDFFGKQTTNSFVGKYHLDEFK